ncbi:hypothetical protein [Haliangium ochraceum]|uniref:hypothetical protein n=1 Tax=Haliangium ochraceum TaxID=80816 RepID=UPI0005D46BBE|nr:hypothetical protein [Haliangium ochraceum]
MSSLPALTFASPRALPKPSSLTGRVVVLDIAFAATSGAGVSFVEITKPFLDGLGDRLAAWVDHHDHERHPEYAGDARFTLATKAEHGACPEMITPELVRDAGPIDCIVTHMDLDGLYAAAKWILGGREPYPGADRDAHCIDTRTGEPGPEAVRIDKALRARFRDDWLKRAVIHYLVEGLPAGAHREAITEAAREFEARQRGTAALCERFELRGRIAYVDARIRKGSYDKTDLLLSGQDRADVALVHDAGMLTIAARYDSGWNFVDLFGLGGGMPTRVSIPERRLDEVLRTINEAPAPRSRTGAQEGEAPLRA